MTEFDYIFCVCEFFGPADDFGSIQIALRGINENKPFTLNGNSMKWINENIQLESTSAAHNVIALFWGLPTIFLTIFFSNKFLKVRYCFCRKWKNIVNFSNLWNVNPFTRSVSLQNVPHPKTFDSFANGKMLICRFYGKITEHVFINPCSKSTC